MLRRDFLLTLGALGLTGCVSEMALPGPAVAPPRMADGAFVMRDGARLPYRAWVPPEPEGVDPWAVVLGLHGFNDSRDAWEIPAPSFMRAGIALYAPDQRGFGEAPGRGLWAGSQAMVDDAAQMVRLLRTRYPTSRLYLVGESMGGAVLMRLATTPGAPAVDGYVLAAPAVWGRAEMNIFFRASLWLADHFVPALALTGGQIHVTASDNHTALVRLGRDRLTIHKTRMDTLKGLVDLMDGALTSARRFHGPALFLYGGKDELVPDHATAAAWRALEERRDGRIRIAYYPHGYHLLFRDRERNRPIEDVIGWIRQPSAPLPSGADRAALAWLARQEAKAA